MSEKVKIEKVADIYAQDDDDDIFAQDASAQDQRRGRNHARGPMFD